jgi:hypothetical protein
MSMKLWWLATYTAGVAGAGRFSRPSICTARHGTARHVYQDCITTVEDATARLACQDCALSLSGQRPGNVATGASPQLLSNMLDAHRRSAANTSALYAADCTLCCTQSVRCALHPDCAHAAQVLST